MTRPGTGHPRRTRQDGLSLVELVIVGLVLLIAAVITFTLVVEGSERLHAGTQEPRPDAGGTPALDQLEASLSRLGDGIAKASPLEKGTWQRGLVFAGPNALAFNADVDPRRGSLHESRSVPLPGTEYWGEGAAKSVSGAETHVFSLDANGDGEVNAKDRYETRAGVFNPARETETPLDFALFRSVHGWDGQSWGGQAEPVAAYLFSDAAAVARVRFPDGTGPRPTFTYWLTEDLDGDGRLSAKECVIRACRADGERSPSLYLWGDSDRDGRLSRKEQDTLREAPVGSPRWQGNPYGRKGSYPEAYITGLGRGTEDGHVLWVSDASPFLPGMLVDIASPQGSTTATVLASDGVQGITLSGVSFRTREVGAVVSVSPRTLLHAVRAVELTLQTLEPPPSAGHLRSEQARRRLDMVVSTAARTIEIPVLEPTAFEPPLTQGPGAIAVGPVETKVPTIRGHERWAKR